MIKLKLNPIVWDSSPAFTDNFLQLAQSLTKTQAKTSEIYKTKGFFYLFISFQARR